ncbi:hypothetical protein Prudu_020271 [Prunus dulcis]|uniref:Uncharacterized protein n=1 Tax=Prunus dulcis TaxID=3755 RepID=A0A4Y1RW19_PRUDU|nr:hypothetical protein Prudu_020271 [Prunus dulcis]
MGAFSVQSLLAMVSIHLGESDPQLLSPSLWFLRIPSMASRDQAVLKDSSSVTKDEINEVKEQNAYRPSYFAGMAAKASLMVLKFPLPSFATVTLGVGFSSFFFNTLRSSWLIQVGNPSLFCARRRRFAPETAAVTGSWNWERRESMAKELLVNSLEACNIFSKSDFNFPSGNPSTHVCW